MSKRVLNCKKGKQCVRKLSEFQSFNCIQWLKSRVPQNRLTDRTVRLKYLVHPAEKNGHKTIKNIFDRFDEDGNSSINVSINRKIRSI